MFNLDMPTRIISGKDCVKNNASLFSAWKNAFIVCGKSGAKKSGALDDVCVLLSSVGANYTVFDKISENPPLLTCYEGGKLAREKECDLVIGIGGGSALDAAKAIASFATNGDIAPEEIFNVSALKKGLPIIAIPTTAGTGSEANPYSVLSLPDGERKQTFNTRCSYPVYSFLDPTYTMSLPESFTVSTALDAFHHALESLLSPKSTDFSEMMALYAAEKIWDVLTEYPENYSYEQREKLLYASCAAGIAISVTGTGFPHPLGYSLTMLDGISHGRACAVFAADYIDFNEKTEAGAARLATLYEKLAVKPKVLKEYLTALAGVELSFTKDEIVRRVDLIKGAKNYQNSPYVLTYDEMIAIYEKHFLAK